MRKSSSAQRLDQLSAVPDRAMRKTGNSRFSVNVSNTPQMITPLAGSAVRRDRYTDSSQLVCVCTQDRGIVLSLYILFSCFFVQPILVHHNGVNGIYCMTLCMFVTWSVGDINGIM